MYISKRLKAEEKMFFSKFRFYTIELDHVLRQTSYTQVDIYDQEYQFVFYLEHSYPFKSPLLYINKQEYISKFMRFYQKNYSFIQKFLKDEYTCPCCSTLLCQWSPQNNIQDLITEFYQQEHKKMMVVGRSFFSKMIFFVNGVPAGDLGAKIAPKFSQQRFLGVNF